MAGRISPVRSVVAENLRAVETAGGRRALPEDVFEAYGRYWGELLALAARPERCARLRVETSGLEYLIEARRKGPVCALGSHMANWDLLGYWIQHELPGIVMLAERRKPEPVFQLFASMRAHMGYRTLPAEGGGRELYRHLRRGGHAGLLVDRAIGAGWREAPFMGGQRRFPSAGMDLARRAGASLLPVFIRREGLGFQVRIHPELDSEADPVFEFARVLETELLAAPEQWFVLYPIHDAGSRETAGLAMRKAAAS